jgi:predicted dehydrogenase
VNRREVLRALGLAASSLSLNRAGLAMPRIGANIEANDKLTIGCIGVGSQGLRVLLDMLRLPEVQVVAVCDVNRGSSDYLDWGPNELRNKVRTVLQDSSWGATLPGPSAGREVAQVIINAFYAKERGRSNYKGCTAYEDFRELLGKEKDLDAVIVSTPDHWHGPIAIASMRAGKHVYSQKPMAHSVWECREMARVAKETGRATQVSVFNSNSPASQQVRELLSSVGIGPVRSIDIWTKRASAFWKQGLATPTHADQIPDGLNWDMWLGPAPMRPFSRSYLPFVWRAWYDFGCGALGDMGEYGFDTISRAVGLQAADRIEASSTDLFPECYPVASSVHFNFAKTASRPEVKLNWYDGGIEPRRPPELGDDGAMGMDGEGVIYTGDSGKLMTAFMGQNPCLLFCGGKDGHASRNAREEGRAVPAGKARAGQQRQQRGRCALPGVGASVPRWSTCSRELWLRGTNCGGTAAWLHCGSYARGPGMGCRELPAHSWFRPRSGHVEAAIPQSMGDFLKWKFLALQRKLVNEAARVAAANHLNPPVS